MCPLLWEGKRYVCMCIFFFFRILTLFMWKHVPSGGGFLKRLFSSLCCSLVTETITQLSPAGELLCKQFQAIWREEQRRFFCWILHELVPNFEMMSFFITPTEKGLIEWYLLFWTIARAILAFLLEIHFNENFKKNIQFLMILNLKTWTYEV